MAFQALDWTVSLQAVEDPDADPLHAFAQRLMVHVQAQL